MNRHKLQLALANLLMLAIFVFLSFGFATLNHVEAEIPSINLTVRYGLFRYCVKGSDSREKCDSIDYRKLEEPAPPLIYPYSYYDNSAETDVAMVTAGYAVTIITSLLLLVPHCCTVREKFLFSTIGSFAASGLSGILFSCLYTKAIIDAWDNYEDSQYDVTYPVQTKRAWSFFVFVAGNSLMVLSSIGLAFLTYGYADSQRHSAPLLPS